LYFQTNLYKNNVRGITTPNYVQNNNPTNQGTRGTRGLLLNEFTNTR
jgi:hypothetical protein